ncbi:hypothetical protein [Paenibacillus alkalitolerans]|uniref:hypothetical protein n=1 Tax=Paenibacillus alkalitolerans TaxID=2799335 RepID=UPI0018F2CF6F|nr:hypothetical protein [Paenibacillus alkalitolerans]
MDKRDQELSPEENLSEKYHVNEILALTKNIDSFENVIDTDNVNAGKQSGLPDRE